MELLRSATLAVAPLALLATVASAQVSTTGPFVGDLGEGFEGGNPMTGQYGIGNLNTAFGSITSPTSSLHRTTYFNSFSNCAVLPRGADRFLVKYSPDCFAGGSYRFDFVFTDTVRSFGGYFAQDLPGSSVTQVQAFDASGQLVYDSVAQLPASCGWHWLGWQADVGTSLSRVMIRHIGYSSLAVDDLTVRLDRPGTTYCTPVFPNSTGARGELHLEGSEILQAGDLDFVLTGLPEGRTGLLLAGRAPTIGDTPFGSQGSICVGGEMTLVPLALFATATDGTRELGLDDPVLPSLPDGTVFVPGETWYFQAWHRDLNPHPTSNTTNAVYVTFQ